MRKDTGRSAGEGNRDEGSRDEPRPDDDDRWKRKDAWLGLLFLGFGAAIVIVLILARKNGFPDSLLLPAWLLGPLLLLLGGNALIRSLLPRSDDEAT